MEVTIHTPGGDVKLNPLIVRRYLVNGNGAVTDQEIALFLGLCKAQQLNPFVREAYLIKYGDKQPAAIVVAKEVFLKRAYRSTDFRGHKAGIICQAPDKPADLQYTEGICTPGARIVGGWAEVHKDGWPFPLRVEVDYNEYVAKKHDGTPNRMWAEKPATMIRKVALVQALREAFPDTYQGMYSEEEVSSTDDLPRETIDPASIIDVPREASGAQQPTAAPARAEAPTEQESQRRSRRHKFSVDKSIFGTDELITCGSTPDQLEQLLVLTRNLPDVKNAVDEVLSRLGQRQLSFLREDEAEELLQKFSSRQAFVNAVKPIGNSDGKKQEEASPPDEDDSPFVDPAMPADLVECPNRGGDRMSVSQYCHVSCPDRVKLGGWCPVLEETPPAADDDQNLI
jgi:phage recombination protein Bet